MKDIESKNIEITEKLRTVGLKTSSAKVFLALLRLQRANAHQIAKEAGIERTTVYNILDELAEKNLVSQSREGRRTVYISVPPEQLGEMLSNQLQVFKALLPLLHALEGRSDVKPTVRYYEGRDALLKIYKETLNCKEKLFRNLAAVPNVEKLLGDTFIDRFTEERVKKGIVTKSLRSHEGRIEHWTLKDETEGLLRENRYLPLPIKIEAFVKIYDNTVLLISFGHIPSAIVIESPSLTQTMKILFDVAWQSAKPHSKT